jgi:D-glycero-D-manno-heptose 1,7-bisphosphate phosphatase
MEQNEILAPRLYVFDKDGCLCKSVEGKNGSTHAPNRLEDQEYFEDVALKCAELIAAGNTLAVASNQGGVAFGIFTADEAELLVKAATEYIGGKAYRVCFYHPKGRVAPWNQEHRTRKPQPGMLIELMQSLNFSPQNTIMVGDWTSDKEAAEAAGCEFRWAHEFFERVDPFADRFHAALGVK